MLLTSSGLTSGASTPLSPYSCSSFSLVTRGVNVGYLPPSTFLSIMLFLGRGLGRLASQDRCASKGLAFGQEGLMNSSCCNWGEFAVRSCQRVLTRWETSNWHGCSSASIISSSSGVSSTRWAAVSDSMVLFRHWDEVKMGSRDCFVGWLWFGIAEAVSG